MSQLYRHYDKDGNLLYIGISFSAILRQSSHSKNSYWWWKVSRIEVENFPDRSSVLEAERQAIISESPIHNIVHNKLILDDCKFDQNIDNLLLKDVYHIFRNNPVFWCEVSKVKGGLPMVNIMGNLHRMENRPWTKWPKKLGATALGRIGYERVQLILKKFDIDMTIQKMSKFGSWRGYLLQHIEPKALEILRKEKSSEPLSRST